jgi:hypothetical protein
MTAILRVALWSFIVFSAQAFAQAPIASGDYLTERGWGALTIEPAGKGALKFSIVAHRRLDPQRSRDHAVPAR